VESGEGSGQNDGGPSGNKLMKKKRRAGSHEGQVELGSQLGEGDEELLKQRGPGG